MASTLGIIGVTVSPTNPENLYAIVEAEKGGVFRSRDGGKTWAKTNDDRSLRQRQDSLIAERATLLQKNEQVRARVEAMIGRLKAMEQNP